MPWLFTRHAFREVAFDVGRSFDNALYLIESPTLRLRFERDRGPTMVDIAPVRDPEFWVHLDVLLKRVLNQECDLAVDGLGRVLYRTLPDIERAMGSDLAQTKRLLTDCERDRINVPEQGHNDSESRSQRHSVINIVFFTIAAGALMWLLIRALPH